MTHNSFLQIAIDGPVAAGKGDIASRLVVELKNFQMTYINTGAMYRMLALECMNQKVDMRDEQEVLRVFQKCEIDLKPPAENESSKTYMALLNGVDVTDRLLDPDVSKGSSDVAVLPEIRKRMVLLQQKLAVGKNVVMEGRDIGLRVLPEAQLKIYLTASVEERAQRRWKQWKEKGIIKTHDEVIEETKIRDQQDMGRKTDPLQKLSDAWELDTTRLAQDEVIAAIMQELTRRHLI